VSLLFFGLYVIEDVSIWGVMIQSDCGMSLARGQRVTDVERWAFTVLYYYDVFSNSFPEKRTISYYSVCMLLVSSMVI